MSFLLYHHCCKHTLNDFLAVSVATVVFYLSLNDFLAESVATKVTCCFPILDDFL